MLTYVKYVCSYVSKVVYIIILIYYIIVNYVNILNK